MTIIYAYDKVSNQVKTEVRGEVKSSDVIDYFNEIVNDPEVQGDFVEVVQFNAEDFVLKFSDLKLLKKISEALINKGNKITLFCAYNDFTQNVAGMMLPLFNNIKLNVFICKNERELERNILVLSKRS